MPLETLTAEDVLRVHEILVADFATSADPISPPGVRSLPLLQSAVGRQLVGHGGSLKYPDPVSNAATLVYGICNDHPFYNGNKRTALVAMLAHLDKNRLTLQGTTQTDLYQLLLAIAQHSVSTRPDPRRSDKAPRRGSPDDEVAAVANWLDRRVQKLKKGERPITFRHLRQTLARFDYRLDIRDANTADVVKIEAVRPSLLRRNAGVRETRVGLIGYRNEGTEVSLKDLKHLRRICHLTESDGVDTDAFYSDAAVVDAFVNRYRTALRRLAKT